MRDTFVRTLCDIARKDKNVNLITGDLGFGVLVPYWNEFPEQFVNAGIAEQNMTGIASGMAMEGKTVFTYSIANFPTLRCIEQIRNDCAYHNANVKIVAVGGGFCYGSLGMSHHATEDIAILRALPDMVVLTPGDPYETVAATEAVYKHNGTCYLRLGRGGEKNVHTAPIENFKLGKAIEIVDGERVAVFSAGGILSEAKSAVDSLREQGVDVSLHSFPSVKPIDADLIREKAKTAELIVTVEEHNIIGGFGSAVAEVLCEVEGKTARMIKIGLNDTYSCIVGTQQYLRNEYGMSAEKIVERIKNEL